MKIWSVGFNDYWKTSSIYLEEVSWFYRFLESLISRFCSLWYWLPFPPIPFNLPKEDVIEGEETKTNLKDWYGDLGQFFFSSLLIPYTSFMYREKVKSIFISLPYNFAIDKFPIQYKQYTDLRKEDKEEELDDKEIQHYIHVDEYSEKVYRTFMEVYNRLDYKVIEKSKTDKKITD